MAKAKKLLGVKIILDTNAIFTGSNSELFKNEIKELIVKHTPAPDLKISWYLPEVVVNERKYQMRKKSFELLPSLSKLERIIGHNLAITEEILRSRIDETINKSLDENSIGIIKLDAKRVDWDSLIQKSCFRLPPFEEGEKEKGFRDLLVIESALQLIEDSPTSKSVCRIIFVSADKLVQQSFEEKTKTLTNVKLLSTLSEVESLINVLSSEITEDLISSIIKDAQEIFFQKEMNETLYYKEKVYDLIRDKFPEKLSEIPDGYGRRDISNIWIQTPGFERKIGQRIYWKTTITIDSKAYKKRRDFVKELLAKYSGTQKTLSSSGVGSVLSESTQLQNEIPLKGKTKFDIFWSITLTTNKSLKSPKIDDIKFVETTWETEMQEDFEL